MNIATRPDPFSAFTTPEFWNDPHISGQMLANHLDPDSPLASRTHDFIDRSVEWIVDALALSPGSRVLDLGCGPGLYANRLARRGMTVVGVDVSERSLDHAVAEAASLPATFHRGDYLQADLGTDYDAAILIYEDYCALSPAQRATLLSRIYQALNQGGRLLFDVTSQARFDQFSDSLVEAPNLMGGFWAAEPYQGTHATWTYPELHLALEHFTITTETSTRQFWNWTHCLTPEAVTDELTAAGFAAPSLYGDVTGATYDPASPTFAVATQRS